jgi:hypothetical protein
MYVDIDISAELRQGDVFTRLPWPAYDPSHVQTKHGLDTNLARGAFLDAEAIGIRAEPAIETILSADCNAVRREHLVVARVRSLESKYAGFASQSALNQLKTKVKVWKSQGVFYLAAHGPMPDSFIEVSEVQVFPRVFLLAYRAQRIATLSDIARAHLREKVAYYLTRYGADDTYFLTAGEIQRARESGLI